MHPITLSIVEDLDEVREGLSQYLGSGDEFIMLETFRNAEDAAAKLPEIQPDIVIVDINLPGMNGTECIREVKKQCSKMQFMMFTVYEDDEKVFTALKAGATGYLLKSTGPAQLLESLKELHLGGSPMSANIARKLITLLQEQERNKDAPPHNQPFGSGALARRQETTNAINQDARPDEKADETQNGIERDKSWSSDENGEHSLNDGEQKIPQYPTGAELAVGKG